jgi:hypothetical protein
MTAAKQAYPWEHLSAALAWIEQNHPGGIALVARALSETYPPPDAPPPVAPGEPGATCGTCGGSRLIVFRDGPWTDSKPCPDCTPSPPRSPEACPDGECHCKHREAVARQRAAEEHIDAYPCPACRDAHKPLNPRPAK